jgi:hypothetical protein
MVRSVVTNGHKGQSECGFECEGRKNPHTQTHAVFLSVKEENILKLKLKLTLFF